MTREEVIKILQELTYKHANLTYIKALDMAIKMLSAETVSREAYEKRTQADEQIIDSYRQEFSEAVSAEAAQSEGCDHCVYKCGMKGGDDE